MANFDSSDDVERDLEGLTRGEEPFVARLPRQPGQKEQRWSHLLGEGPAATATPTSAAVTATPGPGTQDTNGDLHDEVRSLRSEVDLLRAEVAELREALGL
jgi:uncharacterized protein YceH (UPF0502 family)